MNTPKFEQWQDMLSRLYPELNSDKESAKTLSRTITFQVTDACNLACRYCLDGNSLIRMKDYSLKPIKDVKIGDEVLAFEEYNQPHHQRKLVASTVEQLFQRKANVIRLLLDNGEELTITPNHKVLSKNGWKEAGKLKVGNKIFTLPIIDSQLEIHHVDIYNDNYIKGYLTAMIQGDGSLKHYNRKSDGCDVFKFRIAVKDTEIIDRCEEYLKDYLHLPIYLKPYNISKKYNQYENAIFANTRLVFNELNNLINDNFQKNTSVEYYQGYLAGLYDAEGHMSKETTIRICNTNKYIIDEACRGLELLHIPYVIEVDENGTVNNSLKYNIRIIDNLNSVSSYRFIKSVNPSVKRKRFERFLNRASLKTSTIIDIIEVNEPIDVYNIGTSSHTYIANSMAVHNCYQINKGKRSMKFEDAKKLIDMLLEGDERLGGYVDIETSPGIIIEFIGGEPFLEVELIDKICTYFYDKAIEMMHPWATKFCISICSNGTLYRNRKVQKFLNKWRNNMSFSVTIDGNKELHDACRVFPDGSPSYDLAVDAANDWISKGYQMGSKITIAPENLRYMNDAIKHMVSLGYTEINANCVYEKGWTQEHAKEFYVHLKEIADYWNDNDLVGTHYLSLFVEEFFKPKEEGDDDNWCWGKGTPILTVDGYKPIEDIKIGDLVYTEDGSIHPVINTTSHFADNVVNISASGVFDLVCTDNHKLFAKPFDYIGWKSKKHYKEYGKYQVKDIEHNDLIKLFQLPTNNVICDIDLAYVVGRYIGDGWHSTTVYKICCAHEEEAELKEKLDNANIDYSIDDYPTVKQFNLFKSNVELIDILSRCGEGADSKHLPPECFGWSKDSLQSLVNGYMDADGTINKKEQYRFNTVSYILAQELMVVLRTLGYTPTCYHNKRGGNGTILGRDVHIKDRYEVYYYNNSERSKYVHEDDDGMWTYGLKTTNAEPQMVYNITVDENHSYIAGGIASANCGGTGSMLSLDPDGYLYPCIRYMESSLGNEREPLRIGDVNNGIGQCYKCRKCVDMLNAITRRTQSTDECYYCPIAEGCSWCSAYNYQVNGTPDSRATYICEMHKARSLANSYFWNTYYRKHNIDKRFEIHCPDEWALNIISQEELDMLKALAGD